MLANIFLWANEIDFDLEKFDCLIKIFFKCCIEVTRLLFIELAKISADQISSGFLKLLEILGAKLEWLTDSFLGGPNQQKGCLVRPNR